jgi:predicted DNA-binding transcriptional regulator YafY
MTQSLREMLAEAANSGEAIRIVYHGGSQPGTVREISPVSVTDNEVSARDLATGIVKTFKLAKIAIPSPDASAPAYDPTLLPPVEDVPSIAAALRDKIPALEALGWHVQVTENRIALHRVLENGKPRKTPTVTLECQEFDVDLVIKMSLSGVSERQEERKSRRPYHLDTEDLVSTGPFSKLATAVDEFLREAQERAPGHKDRRRHAR